MRPPSSGPLRVVDFGPDRSAYRPGSDAAVSLMVDSSGGAVDVRLELIDNAEVVAVTESPLRLAAGRSIRRFRLKVPDVRRHGYGLRLRLEGRSGRVEAHSALEALDGWWESPRHAALTEFAPGTDARATAHRLRRWHVNVAQFYDWMYRHYRYVPPSGATEFKDTLGRVVSRAVVRDLVRECRRAGIASLAYGSVYGAEREYVERHPDELLRDTDGRALNLGETFFITDLRLGSPWRRRLLREYASACRRFGFDGVHMDQYGEPHEGFAADGSHVRLDELFGGLIDEAGEVLGRLRPPRKVLFNCVDAWPIQQVAGSASAATYLEIWPPDVTYADVLAQVEKARSLAPGKQIVIAAYPSVIAAETAAGRPAAGALEAALLLSSVVYAAGAYHHALAEHDRVLVGGYYPEALRLPVAAAEAMRLAWQFSARYVHLLSDPCSQPFPTDGLLIEADGQRVTLSADPQAGKLWARATKTRDARLVVQLVDLLEQRSDHWDAPREPAVRRRNWRFSWPGVNARWFAGSPWSEGGSAQSAAGRGDFAIPAFERWTMLVGENR